MAAGGDLMEKICCVYKLTNTVTGKFYIGSTYNLKARMKYHRYSYARNPNKELGTDIAKYGWDSFAVKILEECTRENVRDRESFYIDSLNAVDVGYNMVKATTYQELMHDMNVKNWRDPEYREKQSKASSDVQKRRLKNHEYLAQKSTQLKRYTDSLKRPVGMYSKSGELLHTFGGVREAERWLISVGKTQSKSSASSSIADCCKGGRHKTVYGYVWKYL